MATTFDQQIKRKILRWIGHTVRKSPDIITRMVEWNPRSSKSRGRRKTEMEMYNTSRTKTMKSHIGRCENNCEKPFKMEALYGGHMRRKNKLYLKKSLGLLKSDRKPQRIE